GEITSGRANSACALIGTTSSAWTEGHTTGPPAEKAYAVDPVGVAQTMPSPVQRDSGRPSTSTSVSSMRSREAFSTETSWSAQFAPTTSGPRITDTSSVSRSSTSYDRDTIRSAV